MVCALISFKLHYTVFFVLEVTSPLSGRLASTANDTENQHPLFISLLLLDAMSYIVLVVWIQCQFI